MSGKSDKAYAALNLPASADKGPEQLLFIELSQDELHAKVTILPPATEDGKFVTVDDLHYALAQHNVTHGINPTTIAEISAKLVKNAKDKNLLDMITADIATGTPPVKSKDGQIEYFYKNDEEEEKDTDEVPLLEDGRADYKAGKKLDNVVRGSLLVRITPAVQGTPGRTVTNKILPAHPGKEILLEPAYGVMTYPDNPNDYYADENGRVVIRGGRISVQPIYEVKGDVNLSVGNILFFGTVVVHGDIKDGFKVHAGCDLIVRGVIEGAEIQVDGNLVCQGGISGNDKAHIMVKGDAASKYIQNTWIEVDGNLTVKQFLNHSKVTCDHTVKVSDPKGMIVGGQIIARREISAAVYGTSLATPTEVIVGHQVDLWEQIINVETALKESESKLEKAQKAINHLKALYAQRGGNLPPDKQEMHKWLLRTAIKQTSESKMLALKKIELELKQKIYLEEKPVPRINCSYVIYPGTKITVSKAFKGITEEQKYCTLIEYQGEVSVSALSASRKAKADKTKTKPTA